MHCTFVAPIREQLIIENRMSYKEMCLDNFEILRRENDTLFQKCIQPISRFFHICTFVTQKIGSVHF